MMMKKQLLIGALLIMTVLTACDGKEEKSIVPGDDDYGLDFNIDWDDVESGTYIYGEPGMKTRRLGGMRIGYREFYPLVMDFKMKDGQQYHEEIDIPLLIEKLVQNHDILDMRKTKFGGAVRIIIKIDKGYIDIEYKVREGLTPTKIDPYPFKNTYFPMYRKVLD